MGSDLERSLAVLSHDAFSSQVTQLVGSAQHAVQPPDDEDCRAALARVVEPLGKMLLLSPGLLEAVEGRLPGPPVSPLPPAPEPLPPHVERTRVVADRLQADAVASTRQVEWPVVASPQALAEADIADAAPGIGAILDAYVKTLPRVLALAASRATPLSGSR